MVAMSGLSPEPRCYCYKDILEGMKEQYTYVLSEDVYQSFLSAFHDLSPIHVDETYALSCGYPGKVMHGTILNGFLSHFIGMYFPGRLSLLLAADLRFAQPCYLNDVITLETVVSQKLEARSVIILEATFMNKTRDYLAARGRIQVMLRED
jgi:3-hydroxybutyryl-CoA dehydratase